MKTYLVGGAVRDKFLGHPHKEKDWVVVGSSPEEMIKLGYKPVGKDFPVFLHPKTKDEYALARTERKVAKGYKGFEFHTSSDVTLEEDLKRRDLTINAMAEAEEGTLIDLFHGKEDLENKILRHVSPAFTEDPVRILRVARFAAKFGDFTVAPETIVLVKQMVTDGEADALVPERVWQELQRALGENYPWRFFEVLQECSALKTIFPEIDSLFGVPSPENWHPEIDSGIHTMLTLKEITKLTKDVPARFAELCHDFGKANTPQEVLPKHHGHEEEGVTIIKQFCKRLNAPREYRDLAIIVARYHSLCHKLFTLTPKTILKILQGCDAFRRPERFEKFLIVCEADARGRQGFECKPYPEHKAFLEIFNAVAALDIKTLIADLDDQKEIENVIYQERLSIIKELLNNLKS